MRVLAWCGLVVLFCLPGHRASAFGNCLDAGYLAGFGAGLAPQACEEDYYITINAATGPALLRVIRLSAVPGTRPIEDWRPHVETLAAGVARAMDELGTARLPAEITVLMTGLTESLGPSREVHAEAGLRPGGECGVTFYKLEAGASVEEFTFTLAHEIFHCVIDRTWPDASGGEEAGWWVEGSAEYFANLAQPGTGGSSGFVAGFDARSLAEPPVDLDYENVVFFAWLAQRGGPPAVARFLTDMRAGDQLRVLQRLVPLEDWTRFIEDWLDGAIALPGGVAIRPQPYFSAEGRFDGPVTLPVNARPYVIERWDMTFAEPKLFRLDFTVSEGAMRAAMKDPAAGEGWGDPSRAIDTCDGERRYILYHSATEGPASAELGIDTDADTTGGACCLVGTWTPTPETLAGLAAFGNDFGAPAVAAMGGSMTCEYAGGDWLLSFAADGTGRIAFDGHSTRCTARGQGGAMSNTGTRTGHTDFDWTVRGEGNAAVRYTAHEVGWTNVLRIGPVSQTVSGTEDGPSGTPSGIAFTCSESDLRVLGIPALSTYEAAHTRMPEAAP